jgi:hypothetical protein
LVEPRRESREAKGDREVDRLALQWGVCRWPAFAAGRARFGIARPRKRASNPLLFMEGAVTTGERAQCALKKKRDVLPLTVEARTATQQLPSCCRSRSRPRFFSPWGAGGARGGAEGATVRLAASRYTQSSILRNTETAPTHQSVSYLNAFPKCDPSMPKCP